MDKLENAIRSFTEVPKEVSLEFKPRLDQKIIDVKINNRSKYIEWLIYQDLKKNKVIEIDEIII